MTDRNGERQGWKLLYFIKGLVVFNIWFKNPYVHITLTFLKVKLNNPYHKRPSSISHLWLTKWNRVLIQPSLLFITFNINKWNQLNLHCVMIPRQALYTSHSHGGWEMKHIPQQRNALEKALSLDYNITSVCSQLSHSGDSVHMAEMRAATLPTRPLQDIGHWAAAKKKWQKAHIQVT